MVNELACLSRVSEYDNNNSLRLKISTCVFDGARKVGIKWKEIFENVSVEDFED